MDLILKGDFVHEADDDSRAFDAGGNEGSDAGL
jgi:hypothetical protein